MNPAMKHTSNACQYLRVMDQFNGSLTDLVGGGERMISPWSSRRDVPGRYSGSSVFIMRALYLKNRYQGLAVRPEHANIQKYGSLECMGVLGRALAEDENVFQLKSHRIRQDGAIGIMSSIIDGTIGMQIWRTEAGMEEGKNGHK